MKGVWWYWRQKQFVINFTLNMYKMHVFRYNICMFVSATYFCFDICFRVRSYNFWIYVVVVGFFSTFIFILLICRNYLNGNINLSLFIIIFYLKKKELWYYVIRKKKKRCAQKINVVPKRCAQKNYEKKIFFSFNF